MKEKKGLVGRIIILVWFVFGLVGLAAGAVPRLINYQGRLTDSAGAPLNGSYRVSFKIYDAESGGALLWQETHNGVVVQKGLVSLLLGSVNELNLAFDEGYYLEIKVEDDVLSPRQYLAAAGYAIRAATAEYASKAAEVDSLPQGCIIMWGGTLSTIPGGWQLCDGTNGTPDLRGRFIMSVNSGENPGSTGGNSSHNHSGTTGSSSSQIWIDDNSGGSDYWGAPNGHTHSFSTDSANHLPPYYKLAYIMKMK